jgi:GNAT superfamily N-acetyltransferase
MIIRKATLEDINSILNIIKQAQVYFKENTIDQWQNDYPNYNTIETDIKNQVSYVALIKDKIVATFMVTSDDEVTYNKIYEGNWLSKSNYMVIHRIAVDNNSKGLGLSGLIINHVANMAKEIHVPSIRVDTHEENKTMRKTLLKHGFKECGVIYLFDGAKRLAFEKLI